jgi:hypothetical protein
VPKRKRLSSDFVSGVLVYGGEDPSNIDHNAIVRLCDGWESAVAKLFPKSHYAGFQCESSVDACRMAVGAYVLHRFTRANPITWDAQLARLKTLANALGALTGELSNADWRVRVSIWDRIKREFPSGNHDEQVISIRAALEALSIAMQAALSRAIDERATGKGITNDAPFLGMVASLREIAERIGMDATASKQYITHRGDPAPASPFVELVWTIMTKAVPADLREHVHSKGAMAGAVSSVLRRLRERDDVTFRVPKRGSQSKTKPRSARDAIGKKQPV